MNGDALDRYRVRLEEMEQSCRIIDQALAQLPSGSCLNEKGSFKVVAPKGEKYFDFESARGQTGYYLVSDGSGRPYRVRVRPPCFYGMSSVERMIQGYAIADLVARFGMVNMIGGECDR